MSADPFLLPPRSVVSFSGGRTSAYLLRRVLDAFGGALPDDRVVVFCNTGLEHAVTLDFVEEISRRWAVPVRWLEYRHQPGRHSCEEITDHAQASRAGEPFRQVITARGELLPNPVMRFCTAELKIRTTNRFVRQFLLWEAYFNAIGLRADEPARVAKMLARRTTTVERTLFGDEKHVERGASHPPGESPVCPLSQAGVTNADVLAFWQAQPFDLKLPADERTGKTLLGNCVGCFLKGSATLVDIFRQDPAAADWWIEREAEAARGRTRKRSVEQFRMDRPSYYELKQIAAGDVSAPGWLWADRGGVACGGVDECNCTD